LNFQAREWVFPFFANRKGASLKLKAKADPARTELAFAAPTFGRSRVNYSILLGFTSGITKWLKTICGYLRRQNNPAAGLGDKALGVPDPART
jgi:hypothetical protein